ncbi:MAG: DUF805 domain-containing protein [Alphaproteobacteria bacterium]|nr:DUF805 domain-containing protein [Alphaproteobacteria bacterium]
MAVMFEALSKYFQISGRARRKEYWLFVLLVLILSFVTLFIDSMLIGSGIASYEYASIIVNLLLIIPSFTVLIRRLHDIERSGWWILLLLIPFLGVIVIFIFTLLRGTDGDNEYGEDPIDD